MNTVPYSFPDPSKPVKRRRYVPTDPLIRAQRKSYLASSVGKLDKLLEEESRWKRKVTIASNKLASVRREINEMAIELAKKEVAP